jgi:isopenicillin-N N-acyltransferase-like protein
MGEMMRPGLRSILARMRRALPGGARLEDVLRGSGRFLEARRAVYPQYVEELEGLAEGAGLPCDELFAGLCEELWEKAIWGGCTDMAARGRATVDGSTLLAHTNDLDPEAEEDLVILRVQAGNEPPFLAVSVGGLGWSAGFNAAGVAVAGNELSSWDVRPGVPRQLAVRAILGARRLGEAMEACLLPQRASSYNNVIADTWGEVYSMEGSATDCQPLYMEGDLLAHTNHYLSPSMRWFEADRADIGGSVIRYHRALRLLRENAGQLSPERFMALLADHANYPDSICKHGVDSVTVFSIIVDVGRLRAWIGRGRPCQTTYVEHSLEPWEPSAEAASQLR